MSDVSTIDTVLRPMTVADLRSVLALRNHPEIRRYMLTQHEISIEEHRLWFERTSQSLSADLWVLEIGSLCRGFVQFKETNYPGVVDWGFYVAPDAPKGTGKKLGFAALTLVFQKEGLHKVCGQALSRNVPSIEFHKALGFTQEGILRNQHFDGNKYHDMICFGFLKQEWFYMEKEGKGINLDHHR